MPDVALIREASQLHRRKFYSTKIKNKNVSPSNLPYFLSFLNAFLCAQCLSINRYELYFAFACIWAFGSATFQDQLIDWRNEFNKWWQNEFKTIKFPTGSNVFNFFIENETKKLVPWSEKIQTFELDPDIPLQVRLNNFSLKKKIL